MKNSSTKRYYIWGQFDRVSMNVLQLIYNKVNNTFNGPFFKVHLTLAGPLTAVNMTTIDLFYGLGEEYQPIKLVPKKYAFTEDHYRALFIDIQKSEALLNLKTVIENTFGLQNKKYRPHISLFYGRESPDSKKELIAKLPNITGPITLNRLCLVRVDEDVAKWEVEHEVFL